MKTPHQISHKTYAMGSFVLAICFLVLLVVQLMAGCSKMTETFNDAPIKSKDDSPARVISNPDGFSNVAAKCDGPNMIYVIYHGDGGYGSVAVAPNDPRCVTPEK